MNRRYRRWVNGNVQGDGYGKCREASAAMAAAFPELARVRGHYVCPVIGEREHWCCVTAGGEVVDPTAAQFPSQGTGGGLSSEADQDAMQTPIRGGEAAVATQR